jgi:hypothetical protein
MAAKLARLTHKIAIQLHLVAESCNICSSRSRRPVRKLLDTPSCIAKEISLLYKQSNGYCASCVRSGAMKMCGGRESVVHLFAVQLDIEIWKINYRKKKCHKSIAFTTNDISCGLCPAHRFYRIHTISLV